jgi:adenylate kinase family enzyme
MPGVRLSIVGTSGSGKSTVGAAAAARLHIPYVELDSIRHQANWVELSDEEFRARVLPITEKDSWVLDGNYMAVRDILWSRATTVVWLDLPRWQVMKQVVWRSLTRVITQQELWNGNRERWSSLLRSDHPIRWAYSTHESRRKRFEAAMSAHWIRLRSRAEIDAWLASLSTRTTEAHH